jgi:hypothetical protein
MTTAPATATDMSAFMSRVPWRAARRPRRATGHPPMAIATAKATGAIAGHSHHWQARPTTVAADAANVLHAGTGAAEGWGPAGRAVNPQDEIRCTIAAASRVCTTVARPESADVRTEQTPGSSRSAFSMTVVSAAQSMPAIWKTSTRSPSHPGHGTGFIVPR